MENKATKKPDFSKKFEELMQKIENRDAAKQMSLKELRDLKKAIDDEIIHREVVRHIYVLADQLQ